ncbi:MAG TPA: CocE/NonD family hydrolase [Prochlorococcus sp.]|nr:CocE/NonD family hydrolase [Prochlorococcaceae cyanobacterium Fu_MAG_72]|tara:strand:- start:870 stop:2513 length:1644 start_codon:yes stop_codon:yes gene_type:complete
MSAEGQVGQESVRWRDASLTLSDGVKLVSKLWFPKGGGTWPALLMRQPYGRNIASTVTYIHPAWWASHGYLVVVQDVRGQGDSEGDFHGFSQEASDTSQTHAWVRALPECNGRLGTYGFSYQGLTQLLAEPGTPPPDCLSPAMAGVDERNHWSCEGGAHWWHLGLAWGLQLAALQARRLGNEEGWQEIRRSLENGSYLYEGTAILKRHDPQGMALSWLSRSGQSDKGWTVHQPLKSWLRQPMLLLGGWWDPHLQGLLDLYRRSSQAGGNPELHIGPASHLQWWPEAQQLQLNFFNRHLQTSQVSTNQESHLWGWNITTSQWQEITDATQTQKSPISSWGLFSKGMACLDPSEGILQRNKAGSGVVYVVHDPWRPVPAVGGHLSPQPGLVERNAVDQRADVATFTSQAVQESLQLNGIPALHLTMQSDQPGFDLCVALSIVNRSQNQAKQLTTGTLRVQGEQALQLLPRKLLLQPILADLQPGERLRLSIAGAAWPAIGVNPGQDQQPCGPPSSHCQVVTLTLQLSGSKLMLLPLNSGNIDIDFSQEP